MWSALIIPGFIVIFLIVMAFISVLGLLVHEDLRAQAALMRQERDKEAAEREERRQDVVRADLRWHKTMIHHGVDRRTGQTITGVSRVPQPATHALFEQFEQDLVTTSTQER